MGKGRPMSEPDCNTCKIAPLSANYYHGTYPKNVKPIIRTGGYKKLDDTDPFLGYGFYVTEDCQKAWFYGDAVVKVNLVPDAKLLDATSIQSGQKDVYFGWTFKPVYFRKEFEKWHAKKHGSKLPKLSKKDPFVVSYSLAEFAQDMGFDGIKYSDADIVIFNNRAIRKITPQNRLHPCGRGQPRIHGSVHDDI